MADRAPDPEPWLWAGSAANFVLGAGILFGAKVAAVDPNKNTLTTWSRVVFRFQVCSQSLDRFRRVVLRVRYETWNIGPKFRGIEFPVFPLCFLLSSPNLADTFGTAGFISGTAALISRRSHA